MGRSALILTAAAAAIQLIGLVREVYVAAQVGVTASLDALIIGMALPTALSGVFVASVRVAMVPAYLGARQANGLYQARRVAGGVLTLAALVGLAFSLLLAWGADTVVAITGPGLDEVGLAEAASYMRLAAPTVFLAAVATVPFGVCQAEERFRVLAVSGVAGPMLALAFMLATWDTLGLTSVVVGALVGAAVVPALLFAATALYGTVPILTVSPGLGMREYVRHALPLAAGSLTLQLNSIIDRAIASLVWSGGVGALRYADSLVRSPIGAISPAWGGAAYPALVKSAQRAEGSDLGSATARIVAVTIAVFTPISFLSAAVAPVAVATVYSRGAFGADDVRTVAPVVAAFAPIIAILMTSSVVTSALNARRAGTVVLASSIINVVLNTVLDLLLGIPLGLVGIALATSFTLMATLLFKAGRLARCEEGFAMTNLMRSLILASAASLPAALPVAAICWSGWLPGGLISGMSALAVLGTLGLALYLITAQLIGLREPRELARYAWLHARRRLAAQ